jgi:hypothetical protein
MCIAIEDLGTSTRREKENPLQYNLDEGTQFYNSQSSAWLKPLTPHVSQSP